MSQERPSPLATEILLAIVEKIDPATTGDLARVARVSPVLTHAACKVLWSSNPIDLSEHLLKTLPSDLFETSLDVQNEPSARPLRPMVDTDWNRVIYYGAFVTQLIIHPDSFAKGLLTILAQHTADLSDKLSALKTCHIHIDGYAPSDSGLLKWFLGPSMRHLTISLPRMGRLHPGPQILTALHSRAPNLIALQVVHSGRSRSTAICDAVGAAVRQLRNLAELEIPFLPWDASDSALRCLPLVTELIHDGVLDLKRECGISWMKTRKLVREFEDGLNQLKGALEPIARATKCLESSQATLADVYLFWLAIMAYYRDMIDNNMKDGGLQFPDDVLDQIRTIVNSRYKEMIENPDRQFYLATFFLHPGYARSDIMKKRNRNPLSTSIHISGRQPEPTTAPDADIRSAYPAYTRVGKCLLAILTHEINANKASVFTKYATEKAVIEAFRSQFMAYARGELPFTRSAVSKSPMRYWKELQHNVDADVLAHLAIKLFAIVPNSMAEERTMSNFTKLNSPDRASQKVSTLVAFTQIRQHYKREREKELGIQTAKPITLKFRDVAKYLQDSSVVGGAQSDAHNPADPPSLLPPTDLTDVVPAPSITPEATGTPAAVNDDGGARDGRSGEEMAADEEEEEEAAWEELESHERPFMLTTLGDGFEVEEIDGVDLSSLLLRDLLSDKPVEGTEGVVGSAKRKTGGETEGQISKKRKEIIGDLEF